MDHARLTSGNISQQLIALSAPLLAGNILQQLYNVVDAVIVGRFVGDAAFGAVGVAGSVMNLFLFLISGGCDGVGTLLSQFYGGSDGRSFRREFWLSGVFGAGASVVLSALGLLTLPALLTLLDTPANVAGCARDYLCVIFLGFANSFGDSGAAATAIFVGQNTGAGQDRRVREGFHQGQRLLLGLGIFMSLAMIAGAVPCLELILPAGNHAALGYLRLVACFYIFNFLGSGLAGYFQGRGRVNIPVIGATGHISLRVVLSFLLAPAMGLPAVALATGLGWVGVVIFWSILARREHM